MFISIYKCIIVTSLLFGKLAPSTVQKNHRKRIIHLGALPVYLLFLLTFTAFSVVHQNVAIATITTKASFSIDTNLLAVSECSCLCGALYFLDCTLINICMKISQSYYYYKGTGNMNRGCNISGNVNDLLPPDHSGE